MIIIPHYGASELLYACTDALDGLPVEVWDGNAENHYFGGNCNRAANLHPDADYYLFLNNDTIPQPGWHQPLLDALDHSPIAGARLVRPDGRPHHTGVAVARLPNTVHAIERTDEHPSGPVDAVTGACLAIRGDLFRQLHGFDEMFINGYEDIDLCLAATHTTGTRPWYCAESTVVHHVSASGPERYAHAHANQARLSAKWGTQRV